VKEANAPVLTESRSMANNGIARRRFFSSTGSRPCTAETQNSEKWANNCRGGIVGSGTAFRYVG